LWGHPQSIEDRLERKEKRLRILRCNEEKKNEKEERRREDKEMLNT